MQYQKKSFSVPVAEKRQRPCAIHHFVKGQCLRCGQKVQKAELTDGSEGEE